MLYHVFHLLRSVFFCKGLASHTCTAADLRHMALLLREATGTMLGTMLSTAKHREFAKNKMSD